MIFHIIIGSRAVFPPPALRYFFGAYIAKQCFMAHFYSFPARLLRVRKIGWFSTSLTNQKFFIKSAPRSIANLFTSKKGSFLPFKTFLRQERNIGMETRFFT